MEPARIRDRGRVEYQVTGDRSRLQRAVSLLVCDSKLTESGTNLRGIGPGRKIRQDQCPYTGWVLVRI